MTTIGSIGFSSALALVVPKKTDSLRTHQDYARAASLVSTRIKQDDASPFRVTLEAGPHTDRQEFDIYMSGSEKRAFNNQHQDRVGKLKAIGFTPDEVRTLVLEGDADYLADQIERRELPLFRPGTLNAWMAENPFKLPKQDGFNHN